MLTSTIKVCTFWYHAKIAVNRRIEKQIWLIHYSINPILYFIICVYNIMQCGWRYTAAPIQAEGGVEISYSSLSRSPTGREQMEHCVLSLSTIDLSHYRSWVNIKLVSLLMCALIIQSTYHTFTLSIVMMREWILILKHIFRSYIIYI